MSERHPYVLLRCDACGSLVDPALGRVLLARGTARIDRVDAAFDDHDSTPPASGLLVFVRGGEVRYEEPPLCSRCSVAIGVTALVRWAEEEEEG